MGIAAVVLTAKRGGGGGGGKGAMWTPVVPSPRSGSHFVGTFHKIALYNVYLDSRPNVHGSRAALATVAARER